MQAPFVKLVATIIRYVDNVRRFGQFSAMSALNPLQGVVSQPTQSRVVRAYGDEVHFHLTGEQTGGNFTLFTDITPPGGGPPPHYHNHEDELFHVLEGKVDFFKDGEWVEVAPGGTVYMPKGVLHTFRNVGSTPSKLLIRTSPSGFEQFFERSQAEFEREGGPDMKRILQIGAEHGIHFPGLIA